MLHMHMLGETAMVARLDIEEKIGAPRGFVNRRRVYGGHSDAY